MTEEILIEGFDSKALGIIGVKTAFESGALGIIGVKTALERIEFSSNKGFGRLLTNPRMTDNGQTIGERNRASLHEKLDAWLDGTFEEKNAQE